MILRVLISALTFTVMVLFVLLLDAWRPSLVELRWIAASAVMIGVPSAVVWALLVERPIRLGVSAQFAVGSALGGVATGALTGVVAYMLVAKHLTFEHLDDALITWTLSGLGLGLSAAIVATWIRIQGVRRARST